MLRSQLAGLRGCLTGLRGRLTVLRSQLAGGTAPVLRSSWNWLHLGPGRADNSWAWSEI